jgi:hypothetical protein
MIFNVIPSRSIKVSVTLFTLAIFLISIWSLAFYRQQPIGRILA